MSSVLLSLLLVFFVFFLGFIPIYLWIYLIKKIYNYEKDGEDLAQWMLLTIFIGFPMIALYFYQRHLKFKESDVAITFEEPLEL